MSSSRGRQATPVVLVTGGGRGIGRAIAAVMSRDGHAVMVVDVDGTRSATAAAELTAEGFPAAAATADVSKPEDAERVIDETEAELGQISVLVNNVGVFVPEPNRAEEVDFEQWCRVINVNINGTYLMCQRVGRRMIAAGSRGDLHRLRIRIVQTQRENIRVCADGRNRIEIFLEGNLFPIRRNGIAIRTAE